MKQGRFIPLAMVLLLMICCGLHRHERLFNLSHLDHLCQEVTIDGLPCTIVHIYSNAPEYHWTDAAGEGISCVDDVARTAVLYMRAHTLGLDRHHLSRIKRLLEFVLLMQAEDGTFYNFIKPNLTINDSSRTSIKSFDFWAARGYWALGTGFAFFREKDPPYAERLRKAFLRCLPQVDLLLQNYGRYETIDGVVYPTWLMNRYAADATSEFLLGVVEFLSAEPHPALQRAAEQLAEGIVAMQINDASPLNGGFYSWPGIWHGWGNAQMQALSRLATLSSEKKWLLAAEKCARFSARLLTAGWISAYDFTTGQFRTFPQIAYDVRTTALGWLELYRATNDTAYALLAGLAASWLSGNNIARQPMYDPRSGRGYDGIDEKGVNLNAGAESTIEALMTVAEIESTPPAQAWLMARSPQSWHPDWHHVTADARRTFIIDDKRLLLTWHSASRNFEIRMAREGEQ